MPTSSKPWSIAMGDTKEVQCWDGDGEIPPEVSALIKRVAKLEAENAELKAVNTDLDELRVKLQKINRGLRAKLGAIENILAETDEDVHRIPDPTYDTMEVAMKPMAKPDPIDDARDMKSADLFNKMFDQLTKE